MVGFLKYLSIRIILLTAWSPTLLYAEPRVLPRATTYSHGPNCPNYTCWEFKQSDRSRRPVILLSWSNRYTSQLNLGGFRKRLGNSNLVLGAMWRKLSQASFYTAIRSYHWSLVEINLLSMCGCDPSSDNRRMCSTDFPWMNRLNPPLGLRISITTLASRLHRRHKAIRSKCHVVDLVDVWGSLRA